MNITFKKRCFYPDELRILNTIKAQKEKQSRSKIKFYHYAVSGILGIGCTYAAATFSHSFWTFIFGTIAVFFFGFIAFTPYEIYKLKRKNSSFLKQLNILIDTGTVNTCVINAKKIAVAEEYEDEGDLFIIEYDTDKLLYLWDYDYNLKKQFPCLDFEIYEENFHKMLGRQIYSQSKRIIPLRIDKKVKWNYMRKIGGPEHLQTETKNFDKLIQEYNNCG